METREDADRIEGYVAWLEVSADMTNVILMFQPLSFLACFSAGILLMIFIIGFSVSVQEIDHQGQLPVSGRRYHGSV